jgi:IS5 family transposase
MLRERSLGETLWEAVLPPELRELPPELAKIDAILEEERFLAPFRKRLTAAIGRPTTPIDTYLRLMYLKYRYRLGYETLVKEVADSFTWRRFCRIPLDGRLPDPTTLMKLTKRLGPGLLEELNAELLAFAVERKLLRSRRLRVDTTLVESDTRYPTDSGLCAHAVSRLTRLGRRIKASGLAPRTMLRDRRRSIGKRVRRLSATLARGGRTRPAVDRLTAEIAQRTRRTVSEARRLARNGRGQAARSGRGAALVAQLERELAAAEQVLAQTDRRLQGERVIPDRRVSLGDPDARPIRRGNPREPTEFGYKALVADTAEGFVIADVPQRGNPNDETLLEGAIVKAKQSGMQLRSVYANRGFGRGEADIVLARQQIRDPVIPRQGRPAPIEQTRAWKRRYRYRNGIEGRVSQLKRKGLARTRHRGLDGARTWVGALTLTHNLSCSQLSAEHRQKNTPRPPTSRSEDSPSAPISRFSGGSS